MAVEKIKSNWEAITSRPYDTRRMKVFGGWLVLTHEYDSNDIGVSSMALTSVFIPDPNHEWEIDED